MSIQLQTETRAWVSWNIDNLNFPELQAEENFMMDIVPEEYREEHRCDDNNSETTPPSTGKIRWREYFPRQAGQGLRKEPTSFESLRNAQVDKRESIWGAFMDEGDWDFARWILTSGITHASIDELLKLKKVSKMLVVEYRTY